MANNYKNINLNLFDQNVIGDFRCRTLEDGSVRLIQYKDESAGEVSFNLGYNGYNGKRVFNVVVERENREIERVIIIIRSSENCYIVIGSDDNKSVYQRFANIAEISNFIKNNFCRTLLSENKG